MSLKIDGDLGRFKDIVRGKVKSGLKKFVAADDMIGQQGGKLIKIPLKYIDLPRFSYGSRNSGGTSQGDGDIGDPVKGGKKGKGNGQGAGEEDGEHDFAAEFTPDELAQMISEELNLPKLEDKGKGSTNAEHAKYNAIGTEGPEGLRHYKRTYKRALARALSSGIYDPEKPIIIPEKHDKRFKASTEIPAPETNTVVIYMMDVSGSMGEEQRQLVKTLVFWIELLLKNAYRDIESVFIVHDTKAQVVSRDDFYKISTGGGTSISAAYKLCWETIQKRFPFSEWNVYPFHFSDGDSAGDNDVSCKLLAEKIIPNSNVFSYCQTESAYGSGEFVNVLNEAFPANDKLTLVKVADKEAILGTIKALFEKGK
jgi:uncharacterized protein